MAEDIRWRQRFRHFEVATEHLATALTIVSPTEVERAGIIHFFEMTFELGWKTMKDYLEEGGYTLTSPRETIKQAFQAGVITDGHTWIEMLDKRNELTHTYDKKTAAHALKKITEQYAPLLIALHHFLQLKNA